MNSLPPIFAVAALAPEGFGAVAGAFVAGSLAGSFLNVVSHRVPRGETVIHGRSHCPACGATIRAWDNVPVLGWLLLRGRCRDCGATISPRYPLVEAACGCLTAALAVAVMVEPHADPAVAVVAWGGRSLLALTLVAWAMLAARGHVVSPQTAATVAVAAALAAAFVPGLDPLAIGCPDPGVGRSPAWMGRLAASLLGAAAGWMGGTAGGAGPRGACLVVGAALGWQAALLAAGAAAVGRLAGRGVAAAHAAAIIAIIGRQSLAWAWEAVCRTLAGG